MEQDQEYFTRIQNYRVNKSNKLVREQCYDLSLQEQRLITLLIAHVQPADQEFCPLTIRISDFCMLCNIEGKQYEYMKSVVRNLVNKNFWFNNVDRKKWELYSWIDHKPEINYGEGTITIKLSDDLKPYLLNLKQYTGYGLIFVINFKKKYTIRLFDLLRSYTMKGNFSKKDVTIDIAVLKEILNIKITMYPQFKDFNRRVLAPSVKEINKYSDISVCARIIKEGKKAQKIGFTIQLKPAPETIGIYATTVKMRKILNINPPDVEAGTETEDLA